MAIVVTKNVAVESTQIFEETTESTAKHYRKEVGSRLTPEARKLLENYSGIPSQDVEGHVHRVRDLAWVVRPYPCIGQFAFLHPHLSTSPAYPHVLSALKSGHSILDVGSCFAQDLRNLASDGTPTDKMFATDLINGFWGLSYSLFRDKGKFKARFATGDCLKLEDEKAPENQDLLRLVGPMSAEGGVDIIHTSLLLHLFPYEQQLQVLRGFIIVLSKPAAGAMIVGNTMGREPPGPVGVAWGGNSVFFLHNEATLRRLWKEVGEETGTKWDVDVWTGEVDPNKEEQAEDPAWYPEGGIRVSFAAKRQ